MLDKELGAPATGTGVLVAEKADGAAGATPKPSRRGPLASLGSVVLRTERNPWAPRAALVLFAVALFVWPNVVGDPTRVRQWAEYLCYAIVAVGIDIAWGYGGLLVLGQGVFFGLGAYAMGMYLTLEQVKGDKLPAFMSLYGNFQELPLIWRPFRYFWFAAPAAILLPVILATLLGWLVFKRRVRGPYFAILTQATSLVFWLLVIGQLQLTAGTNGLTNFVTVFGRSKYSPDTIRIMYTVCAIGLLVAIVIGRQLVRSRFGRLLVATRDSEDRVRFLGYDPAVVKTVAFAVAAGMAGLAGAFSAPVLGIVAPNQFAVLPSILFVCAVAVGGRGALWGAVVGALLVYWGRTTFSEVSPERWLYVQGLLFVIVLGFARGGIVGGVRWCRGRLIASSGGDYEDTPRAVAEQAMEAPA
jgi:urea transport system permease protein